MRLSVRTRRAGRRLRRLKKARPMVVFEAGPGLASFYCDEAKRICLLAANRTGKTRHAIAKLVQRLLAADRAGHPERWRVMGPTHSVLVDTHMRYLSELLGGQLAEGSNWRPKTGFASRKALTRGGSWVEFCTYKQDPETLESASLHGVLLDEPPPPQHFDACIARVFDTSGFVWVTLTSVNRPTKWLRELVEAGAAAGDWAFYQVPLSKEACPWYTRKQIEAWKRDARRRPWSYRQRIEAEWEGTSDDRWFSGFSDDQLVTARIDYRSGWPLRGQRVHLVLTADHGEGAGHAHWVLLGYQIDRRHPQRPRLYIRALCEWTNDRRMSVAREARAVQKMLQALELDLPQVSFAVGDTNAASKSESARTLNELFEQEFARLMDCDPNQPVLHVKPAKKGADSVQGQVGLLNGLFDAGELAVSEACVHVVESLRHWSGKDDELKHAADSFRYGVKAIVDEVGWEPQALMAA